MAPSPLAHQYQLVTHWRVTATLDDVAAILCDPLDLPRWWPSVYLSATELTGPGPHGLGRRVRLHTKGWLPYTLCWVLEVVHSNYPHGFAIAASGDLEGSGVWSFAQRDHHVDATFEWHVRVRKPLLRRWSPVFKPVFAANHRWAMRQGEKSLIQELQRRHHQVNAGIR